MNFIEAGKAAHANGDLRAPAMNAHVQDALANLEVGSTESKWIMSDFTKGYDLATEAELNELLAA